jgi:hypothetical protein
VSAASSFLAASTRAAFAMLLEGGQDKEFSAVFEDTKVEFSRELQHLVRSSDRETQ